jgi:hypothetical protein
VAGYFQRNRYVAGYGLLDVLPQALEGLGYGEATGIDSSGNVVGFHQDTTGAPMQAFLWNFATGAHFLPGLPGGSQTAAVAISNVNPEILGWALDAHGLKHAVIWMFQRS